MNLTTTYLGMDLSHPLMPGASPLADSLDMARRLEDAGASAIVMRSLFQEQVEGEHQASVHHMEQFNDIFAESLSFFPNASDLTFNPNAYLEHIRHLKASLDIPVIASLNGISVSGWLNYAKLIEQAGADALELNVYYIPTQTWDTSSAIEHRICEIARHVRQMVQLPLAVKLSPFYTALPNLVMELRTVGIDGFILFNRFYQPDFDLDSLSVTPRLHLSESPELLLRLHWLAILYARCSGSLAASGGVHTATDAIKAVMAGAQAVQVVSALLKHGPSHLKTLIHEMKRWMEENEFESIRQMRGNLSLARCADPAAFERGNYMRVLNSWQGSHRIKEETV